MRKQVLLKYIFVLHIWKVLSIVPGAGAQPRYLPSGLQIGMEWANPIYYRYYKQVNNQQEVRAMIDFSRIIVEGDYGWGNLAAGQEGKYVRGGLSYNLAPDTPDKNAAFLGLQHARSFLSTTNDTMYASWYEVVAGVNVRVWKIIYAGSTLRYKFGFSTNKKNNDWAGPHCLGWGGYGQGDDETLGVTYYISLRIPLFDYRKS